MTEVSHEKVQLDQFKTLEGNSINLTSVKYKNKPIILQIFGSWCSNCSDEFKFLEDWFEKHNTNINVIALGFEKAKSEKHGLDLLKKYRTQYKAENFEFSLASYDKDKKKVSEVLPFIKKHLSYPTMIFLDKNHKIYKVHTGFSGKATGNAYVKFTAKFEKIIKELL